MRAAIIIAPKDFKDESVSQLKMMFAKWDVQAVIASYSKNECIGYHGASYKPDMSAADVKAEDFDALVLVDGKGVDDYKLYDFRQLLDTVKLFSMRKKTIVAIGNAMKIIARANIISATKISVPRDEETRRLVILYHGTPTNNEMESDKGILTLNNSDKVVQFADLILDTLGAK